VRRHLLSWEVNIYFVSIFSLVKSRAKYVQYVRILVEQAQGNVKLKKQFKKFRIPSGPSCDSC
jgi:23S rRNA A1618 N6-methylase RlmF